MKGCESQKEERRGWGGSPSSPLPSGGLEAMMWKQLEIVWSNWSRRTRDIDWHTERERKRETVHPAFCHLQMWNVAVGWPWALITDLSLCLSLVFSLFLSFALLLTVKASQPEQVCTHSPLLQAPVSRHRPYPWFSHTRTITHTRTHTMMMVLQLLHLELPVLIMIHSHKTTNSFIELSYWTCLLDEEIKSNKVFKNSPTQTKATLKGWKNTTWLYWLSQ